MATLKQGASGPDVKNLQQKLKDLGFDPNGVDGHFGPGTTTALKAFQQSKGLQADGIAGPNTLAALQSGGGSPSTETTTTTEAEVPSGSLNLAGLSGRVPDGVISQIPQTASGLWHHDEFATGSLPRPMRARVNELYCDRGKLELSCRSSDGSVPEIFPRRRYVGLRQQPSQDCQ